MSTYTNHHVRPGAEPPTPQVTNGRCGPFVSVELDDGAVTIFARDPQQLLRIGDAFYKAARLLARQIDADARGLAEASA